MERFIDGLSDEEMEQFRDRLRDLVADLKARAALVSQG